ncbi:hypothetical protein GCM10028862_00910 [Luteimonas pelagia]
MRVGKSPAKKTTRAAKSTAGKAAGKGGSKRITASKALANTRRLLEAKRAHDRQPQPWEQFDAAHAHGPAPGYQSGEAAAKARELHDAESRLPAIEGSVSTTDRRNQAKRDGR